MKYALANKQEALAANMRLVELIKAEKVVDIKEVKPRRSLPQNNFLHLLLTDFAMFLGETLLDTKDLYKAINHDIYYRKKNVARTRLSAIRSSADLDKAQMQKSIDKLREVAAQMGHPLPEAHDAGWERYILNEAERQEQYL